VLPAAPSSGRIEVPVVIHNVHAPGGEGYLQETWIEAQMDTLNSAFARAAPFSSQRIEFNLVGVNRIEDATWFANTWANLSTIRSQVEIDPDRVLNLYIGNNPGNTGGVGGRAQFAYARYRGFTGNPGSSGPNEGGTVVHEVGHYLGLYHVYIGSCSEGATGQTCSTQGDLVCDTPPQQPNLPYNCVAGQNTCTDYLGP
jgi:hypothetical protein